MRPSSNFTDLKVTSTSRILKRTGKFQTAVKNWTYMQYNPQLNYETYMSNLTHQMVLKTACNHSMIPQ